MLRRSNPEYEKDFDRATRKRTTRKEAFMNHMDPLVNAARFMLSEKPKLLFSAHGITPTAKVLAPKATVIAKPIAPKPTPSDGVKDTRLSRIVPLARSKQAAT